MKERTLIFITVYVLISFLSKICLPTVSSLVTQHLQKVAIEGAHCSIHFALVSSLTEAKKVHFKTELGVEIPQADIPAELKNQIRGHQRLYRLGSGGEGTVYRIIGPTGQSYLIKVFKGLEYGHHRELFKYLIIVTEAYTYRGFQVPNMLPDDANNLLKFPNIAGKNLLSILNDLKIEKKIRENLYIIFDIRVKIFIEHLENLFKDININRRIIGRFKGERGNVSIIGYSISAKRKDNGEIVEFVIDPENIILDFENLDMFLVDLG